MRKTIFNMVDNGEFLAIKEKVPRNIIAGFVRLGGCSAGIVENQSLVYAGRIDCDPLDKSDDPSPGVPKDPTHGALRTETRKAICIPKPSISYHGKSIPLLEDLSKLRDPYR